MEVSTATTAFTAFRVLIYDTYDICKNKDSMLEYEIASAKAIIIKKKKTTEEQEIKNYLYQKGYMSESVNIALEEINN